MGGKFHPKLNTGEKLVERASICARIVPRLGQRLVTLLEPWPWDEPSVSVVLHGSAWVRRVRYGVWEGRVCLHTCYSPFTLVRVGLRNE